MTGALRVLSRPGKGISALFLGGLLLQTGFLHLVGRATGDDLFSIVISAALLAPFLIMILFLYPYTAALLIPLFVIIPGSTLGFTVAEYLLLAVLFVSLLRAMASGSTGEAPKLIEAVFLIYVGWAALSMSQVIDLRDGLEGLRRIILLFLAFLVGRRIVGSTRTRQFILWFSVLPILVALELAFVILRSGYPISALLTRVGALTSLGWGYSNFVAAVGTLPLACGIPLILYGRPGERALGICAMFAAGFVSIATVSRGGTLVLGVALLLALILEARRRSILPMFLFAAMGSIYMLSPFGQANLARFVNPQDLGSVGARVVYFEKTWRVFREHWLLGIGPDQISYYTASFIDRNPHNIFLKNAVELGVLGLGLYVLLLVLCFREAVSFQRRAVSPQERMVGLAFILVLAMAVINASFEPTLETSQFGIPFWMAVGAFAAVTRGTRSGEVES